jgi:predicted Zn finger-like uncharacterized protein
MLTLAVTASDLRMGQGYVRCGRCANVFNALLTLSQEPVQADGSPADATPADRASSSQIAQALREAPPEPAPSSAAAPSQPEPESEPEADSEAEAQAQPNSTSPGADSMHLPTEHSSDGAIENESNFADGTGTFETIVLEGEAITQTEEYVPESSVDSEIAALTERLAIARGKSEPSDGALEALSDADADAVLEVEADAEATDGEEHAIDLAAFDDSPPPTDARPATRRWPWIAGSAALLLLLALQAVNHWRDTLAVSPAWNTLLTRAYGAIGVPLDPHWDIGAYEVVQQGAVADPNDSQIIRVRLSLANHAERAQPLPLLRLTLLDRYGKRIAASELTPSQYWPSGAPPRAFLGHDERIDSQLSVRDPSASSASFELDVCLRSSDGALRCGADQPPSPAIAGAAHP